MTFRTVIKVNPNKSKQILLVIICYLSCISTIQAQFFDEIEYAGFMDIKTSQIKATKVKSIIEESDCFTEQEKPPFKLKECENKIIQTFDKNGNVSSMKLYSENRLSETYTYSYENDKRITDLLDDGDEKSKTSYIYNSKGFLQEKKEFENNKLTTLTTYKYDTKGLLIERYYDDIKNEEYAFGTNDSKYVFTYNNEGRCISRARVNEDGHVHSTKKYKYSNEGLTIIEKREAEKGIFMPEYSTTYDKNGNYLEKIYYDFNGKQEKRLVFKYDIYNNRVLDEEYNADGQLVERNTYVYNENQDIIEEIKFTPKEMNRQEKDITSTTKYTYQYDKRGNWKVQVGYNDWFDTTYATKRTIKYY